MTDTGAADRARLEAELANLRAGALTLDPCAPEHRVIVAHVINEMRGWAAERVSLANHDRQPWESVHWREVHGWLTGLLGTLPGKHVVSKSDGVGAWRGSCWCPIGEDHPVPPWPGAPS